MYFSPALVPQESYTSTSFLSASSSSSSEVDELSCQQLRDMVSILQLSSFTHYRENRSLLSPLFSPKTWSSENICFPLFPTSSSNIYGSLPSTSSLLYTEKLDILNYLPSEISVKILLYLQPEDICNAILVCSRWYQLAQYHVLERRRKTYVQEKRDEYQKNKENYASIFVMPSLYNYSPNLSKTPSPRPLNNIQLQGSPHHQVTSPTNTWIDNGHQQLPKPPSPTYFLAEDVNCLSLDEKQQEVETPQHCRFVSTHPLSPTGGMSRKGGQYKFLSLRRTLKEVVGKKINRSRLRRL